MGHVTKIAAVENATAIWEYDPLREDNRVLGGSLDVIAAIRTLAIKVCMIRLHPNERLSYMFHRFKRRDSGLSTSKALKYAVESLSR